jgi:hypothetical protein
MLCDFSNWKEGDTKIVCQRKGCGNEFSVIPGVHIPPFAATCKIIINRKPQKCKFIGKETDRELCGSCFKKTYVKIYECSHPELPETTRIETCQTCTKYEVEEVNKEPSRRW